MSCNECRVLRKGCIESCLRFDKGGFDGKHKQFEELAKLQTTEIHWSGSPSMNSKEFETMTSCLESGIEDNYAPDED
ncbi:hypothetical protein GmHk_19G055630 [Glycine max]|nr:hypothetical protein GmHk_19G055630 [Glycine max]